MKQTIILFCAGLLLTSCGGQAQESSSKEPAVTIAVTTEQPAPADDESAAPEKADKAESSADTEKTTAKPDKNDASAPKTTASPAQQDSPANPDGDSKPEITEPEIPDDVSIPDALFDETEDGVIHLPEIPLT